MTDILIVGCGDLGSEVARQLIQSGHAVTGLRASRKPLPLGVTNVQADVTQMTTLSVLNRLRPAVLIYSVAAQAQTDESYYSHYVRGLKNTISALDSRSLNHVFFVSSTRVYGQESDALLDETSPVVPKDFGGERLHEAEQYLASLKISHTVLRLSGIYGPARRRLVNLARQPAQWPAHNGWTNRIHRDDAARFMVFLTEKVINQLSVANCYVVSDSLPIPQYDVLIWLARQQGLAVDHVVTPPINGGKRLSNQRLLATGFELAYPTYESGYLQVLQNV